MTINIGMMSSACNTWETPKALFAALDAEFNFNLDVCALPENAKCPRFFIPRDDALTQWWLGRVWCNPPYGRGIDQWVRKAFEQSEAGRCTCVCLLPARTDTRWWHDYVMRAREVRFCTRRLTFDGAGNKAPFPAAIVVFSKDRESRPILGRQVT